MRLLTIMVLTLAAALARADWVDYEVPLIPYESVPNFLKYSPEMNLGEVLSVAVNSRGYIMVLNHPGSANNGGPLYRNATSQLLEFDPEGYFVREIGQNVYGFGYSHTIPLGWRRTSWPHLQAHPERHDPGCAGRDRPATGPVQLASRHRLLAGRRPVHSGYEQLAGAEADIESLTVARAKTRRMPPDVSLIHRRDRHCWTAGDPPGMARWQPDAMANRPHGAGFFRLTNKDADIVLS